MGGLVEGAVHQSDGLQIETVSVSLFWTSDSCRVYSRGLRTPPGGDPVLTVLVSDVQLLTLTD